VNGLRYRSRAALALAGFVCVLPIIVWAGIPHSGKPSATEPQVPRSGAYLGAWVNPDPFSQAGRVSSVTKFEQAIGRPLDFVHLYRRWGQRIGTESDRVFAASGKDLLLSWQTPDLREIVSGHDDMTIERSAREIAALPTKVFLEVRWEMDRPNLRDVVHSPRVFIAAWDHIRVIFAREQVTNVAWTWCPTAAGFAHGDAPDFYPGDDEVDWVCADVYPTTPWVIGSYQSFASLATPFLSWAAEHPKPVIIGEFAVDAAYGPRRGEWITDAFRFIESRPQIKAVAWFEQSLPTDPAYRHWALQGDPVAMHAFADAVSSDPFRKDD
jgi:hypothetical protein